MARLATSATSSSTTAPASQNHRARPRRAAEAVPADGPWDAPAGGVVVTLDMDARSSDYLVEANLCNMADLLGRALSPTKDHPS
ncbi:hypothetical protein GCM10007368_33710 [Isoptericola cucumis]|uniref:Uncharacterized protein n=1 Tax=Isoptericola cucumis TaxID=1776856 RepID=A0ABQ2B943_9MICO|nr:hypothetical protein GCM10007368_33710 [Isoptericola cucumis]